MSRDARSFSRWDTVWLDLDPARGSEQAGPYRPAIIVSADAVNARVPVVLVIPLTKANKARGKYPFEVVIPKGVGGTSVESLAMPQQIRSVSVERIHKPLGHVTQYAIREAIEDALLLVLGIDLDS